MLWVVGYVATATSEVVFTAHNSVVGFFHPYATRAVQQPVDASCAVSFNGFDYLIEFEVVVRLNEHVYMIGHYHIRVQGVMVTIAVVKHV